MKPNIICFAHNARGYDNHFILNDLFQRKFEGTEVIMSGNKVLRASTGNIKFLDSLMILQQPLASLPKAFGFEHEVVKGFFPHMFHCKENMNHNGHLPDKADFGSAYMKPSQKKEFDNWYRDKQNEMIENCETYNLRKELEIYCENDVKILLMCVQSFRKIFLSITDIDPITRCFTLSQMGLEFFRAKILPKFSIGITPINGYSYYSQNSNIANSWLDYQSKAYGHIDREIKIGDYFADGFNATTETVFEYNGCFYHGHHCLFPNDRDKPIYKRKSTEDYNPKKKLKRVDSKQDNSQIPCTNDNETPNQRFKRSQEKMNYIINKRKFKYVEEWDCDLVRKKRNNSDLKKYMAQRSKHYKLLKKHKGVDIRDAFFGGRTNNIRFWCDSTNEIGWKISYYDFRSLYPYVLKYRKFPVGHPEVITENFKNISEYFGFAKCMIQPPKKLYMPVLPYRNKKGKLLFPLCKTCADSMQQDSCSHSNEERQLIGTWTTEELKHAVARGYEIKQILEIYHYTSTSQDLFAPYVDIWLKYKQESDGWPSGVVTEEEKEQYVASFLEHEGIQLDQEKIKKNPGLRFIAKLFLNTLWGKLAQRCNLKKTRVCHSYHQYWELANNDDIIILGELMVNEDTLIVNYKYKSDDMCKEGNTSLSIAAYVTSWARLKLLELIEEIETEPGRILYMDTDSVIFVHHEDQTAPKTGDYLGDLADEITKDYGPEAKCIRFCSLGPKVYALEIQIPGKENIISIKVKGIRLTDRVLSQVTMSSMFKLAEEYTRKVGQTDECRSLFVPQMQIRPSNMQTIETKLFDKRFRAMSEKRRIINNDTLPYGYVGDNFDDN